MAITPSNMIPLGTKAPDFNLIDAVSSKSFDLESVRGEKGTVIMFICNHCPFVKHVNDEIVRICNDYHVTGFGFAAINSNDVENYPEDAPDKMWETTRK
jgi:thiol-disulfide isomerase/thioredoxin